MYPIVQFGEFSLPVFQLVLFSSVFLCILIFIISPQYDITRQDIFMQCMPMGTAGTILGGKLLYAGVMLANGAPWDPGMSIFDGFVFYGGMLGGFLGIALVSLVKKRNILDHLDVVASLLPLGQSLGRLGCYCNGCCYGCSYDGFLAVPYPVNGTLTTVFPTWFFESTGCLILFFILHFVIPKYRAMPTAWYLIGYALLRFFVEFQRGDQIRGVWYGISTSQFLSIAALGAGIRLAYFAANHQQFNLFFSKKE